MRRPIESTIADFTLPEQRARRWRARVWLAIMYAFFGLVTGLHARSLIDPAPQLLTMGWRRAQRSTESGDFIESSLWRRG